MGLEGLGRATQSPRNSEKEGPADRPEAARHVWQKQGYPISIATPSGVATARYKKNRVNSSSFAVQSKTWSKPPGLPRAEASMYECQPPTYKEPPPTKS